MTKNKLPRLHRKLRKAMKDIHIEYRPVPVPCEFYSTLDGNYLVKTQYQYLVVIKPGVKITKWHRLAQMKGYIQFRAFIESISRSSLEVITNHINENYNNPSYTGIL